MDYEIIYKKWDCALNIRTVYSVKDLIKAIREIDKEWWEILTIVSK